MESGISNEVTKSVAVVIFRKDEVLLVRNGVDSGFPNGMCDLPAGRIESGENWEEAATRECFEETGLTPKKLIRLPTFYEAEIPRKNGQKIKACLWSFYCPEYEGELRATSETEPMWVKISKLKELPLVINVDKMIEEALTIRK